MFSSFLTRSGVLLVVALSLSACELGKGGTTEQAGAGADETTILPPEGVGEGVPVPTAASADIPKGELEAPELFKTSDKALWDGRPSLGGTWIAHPDVTDPQRVVIRNTENGKSIIAALFRRERDLPGPAFQMSSDAANKLGLLAGQPAVVEVVALKRPEPPKEEEAVPPPATAEAAAAEAEAGAVETTSLEGTEGTEPAAPADDSAEAIAAAATAAIGEETPAAEGAAFDPTAEAAAVAPVKPGKPLPKPFVEIGYFQQEANATAAAERITAAGMTPQVVPATLKGQPAFRVIVGPAATVEDRAKLIADLKAMGFGAAKAVKG
jgi:rare lipoprotein A